MPRQDEGEDLSPYSERQWAPRTYARDSIASAESMIASGATPNRPPPGYNHPYSTGYNARSTNDRPLPPAYTGRGVQPPSDKWRFPDAGYQNSGGYLQRRSDTSSRNTQQAQSGASSGHARQFEYVDSRGNTRRIEYGASQGGYNQQQRNQQGYGRN
ncbi:Protein of unknown function [Pyronema omphalodes CBS 100304]|uniref:Uncharacterized protein n=1 Tax=Pyronema omphalodes (strain CBS 100304) TaxID=1076935 RepID=U4LDI5_PYROM|nr:Protein of unknown function [Pyronema omphalodes CBS 100304]